MSPESLIQLSDSLRSLYIKTAQKLKGSDRRQFMAEVVKGWGRGGATIAERELGWNRRTIRKGMQELEHGISIADSFRLRGSKPTEHRLPNLLEDICSIVEPQSQTDPSFESTRLYTRLSAAQVCHQLIQIKGYQDEELPTAEVIRQRLNQLGYGLKRVAKTKPIKQIPETEAIFKEVNRINQQADDDQTTLRISIDAKVGIKIGEFDRGGKTRVKTVAYDHDFSTCSALTPYGIFLPEGGELFLFFVQSKLTADCIVDILEQWWMSVLDRFAHIRKLVINQDNGSENHSRRTQFMYRILEFSDKFQLTIQLAYYPPYHSKYNPVERAFGWLEQHWRGSLLESVDTVLQFASTLTFKGKNPVVTLVEQIYHTGVKLTQQAMAEVEKQIYRLPSLKKWFVEIFCRSD
ncbi:MAG: ISAzo13 family transposase [Nostoc sp. DedQUE04]|nr:ISAzo13 family transposase [Nostoc sp. DedQUE04]MDZ8140746.1 ISAzo13 family transposase [Nostoc sp. DedQUE04]